MFKISMIVDDSFSRLTARMIVEIVREESELAINYHAPFDRGLKGLCHRDFADILSKLFYNTKEKISREPSS